MKKKPIIAVALIAIVAVIGWNLRPTPQGSERKAPVVWVKTFTVKESTAPKAVRAIGTLAAPHVDITPELAGHIKVINFSDGARVKAGDVLIELEDDVYEARLASAQAKLNMTQHNFKRISKLGKKGIVSHQAVDQAKSVYKERRAEMNEAAAMLKKTKLHAPFSGVVGKSSVSAGDYVNAGQQMVTVTDTAHYRIEYNLPEKYIATIKLGQPVEVSSSAYPNQQFTGAVSFISPTINANSRTLFVYAELPKPQRQLAAGMFVDVTQSLGDDEKVLVIPERSLVPILDGQQVYKVVDGKAYSVKTMIGQRTNGQVRIISGLKVGDVIVTDGQMKLKNGMPIKTKS